MFNNMLMGAAGESIKATSFPVDNSAVFNKADAEYLAADSGFGTPSNADVGTISMWFKRGNLGGTNLRLFTHGSGASVQIQAYLTSGNTLVVGNGTEVTTTQVFRDPHAWYHLVVRVDTSLGTAADRVRLYLNGSQITSFSASSYPSQNGDVFTSTGWRIGSWTNSTTHTFDGYMSQVVYCDGQSLAPASFGETDDNGVWRPIDVSGLTFGSNGFYLNMAASGSDLGDDASGNSNDFTNTNSATQSSDSPTNNHITWTKLKPTTVTTSQGNTHVDTGGITRNIFGSIGLTTGKWYWEIKVTSNVAGFGAGLAKESASTSSSPFSANMYAIAASDGTFYNEGSGGTSGTGLSTNDIMGLAYDADAGKIWIAKNNTWMNSGDPAGGSGEMSSSIPTTEAMFPFTGTANVTMTAEGEFGATAFTYTPPTGFNAINTTNLLEASAPTIGNPDDHFKEVTVNKASSATFTIPWNTYNGSSGTYDTLFSIKRVGAGEKWFVVDTVRGLDKYFSWDATTAQSTDANVISVSGTTGTLGSTLAADSYLVQMYKLGAQASRETSNSEGSITGTGNSLIISANTTAGWSLCTYVGTGANGTFGHGLDSAPEFVRWYNTVSADAITVYHAFGPSTPATHYGNFDDAAVHLKNNDATKFNSTAPSSTVNSVGSADSTNGSTDAMWCFSTHSVAGFNRIGAFTGNGAADGPAVISDVSAKSVMIKNADDNSAADRWHLISDARFLYNADAAVVFFDGTDIENATNLVDFLSNGFKVRVTDPAVNESTDTMVYQIIGSPFAATTPATAK